MKCWFAALLAALLTAGYAHAQSSDPVDAGIAAYERSDYVAAERLLGEALADAGRYEAARRAEIHRYMAMTHLAFNRYEAAREQFVLALIFNPELSFDEALTSPKILRAFNEAKAIHAARRERKTDEAEPSTESKPGAWRRPVGWSLVGVGGASLVVSAVTYGLMWDTHARYEDENESQSRADDLQAEGLRYRAISGATFGVGAVLAGTGAYLLLTDPARDKKGAILFFSPAPRGAVFGVRGRF